MTLSRRYRDRMVERAADRSGGNLPAAVTSFVGRRRSIDLVRQCLSTSRLVTLTGPGGVGKTRLAVEVAAASHRVFTDGVWLVDLAPITNPDLVTQAVATELGVRKHSTRPALEQLVEFLTDRRRLLVLDNCEHVLDACTVMIDHMLRSCPRLRILATSREMLGIQGEALYPVPSLTAPDPEAPVSVEALTQYESVSLLVDRASAVSPGFAVTEQNQDAVARLCAGLDGLPLAIELAAIRLRSLTVEQVVARLSDRFALLTIGSRAALPRQRTLRALIDWSYDLCPAPQQRLWARLSVFSNGFDQEAAEEVCADDDVRREEILNLLDGLIARSIVTRVDADRRPRFRMLETIRQYGHDRLVDLGELESARQRHREFFHQVACRTADNWCGPGQEDALARLRADHGNLRAALESSLADPPDTELALGLCAALCWHWCAGGFLTEGRSWMDRILALPAGPSVARGHALWAGGWIAVLQGDLTAAERWQVECEALSRQLHDRSVDGRALSLAASIASFRGQLPEAAAAFEESTETLTDAGDRGVMMLSIFQLAGVRLYMDGVDQAAAAARRVIGMSEECGDHWARSFALSILARCLWLNDELDDAQRMTEAALKLQRGFRDGVGAALMTHQLAWIAASKREFTRAASLLGAAHSIWRIIGTDISAFGSRYISYNVVCESAATGALREAEFQAAFEQGMQRSVEQAMDYALQRQPTTASTPTPSTLTRREREVAELVAEGLSNRRIAERLVLSPRTVDGHVERILAKLGFASRAQIAAWVATVPAR